MSIPCQNPSIGALPPDACRALQACSLPSRAFHTASPALSRGHLVLVRARAKADGRADRQLPRRMGPDPDAVHVCPVGCAHHSRPCCVY